MNGLLDGGLNNPLLNLGVGLLSQSGYSTTPISLGQALAVGAQNMQSGQRRKLTNDLLRERITETSRRRKAEQDLTGLLSRTVDVTGPKTPVTGMNGEDLGSIPGYRGSVPAIATPEGRQEAMGLLGQIAPAQVANSLLNPQQPTKPPKEIALAQYLYPNDPAKQQAFIEQQTAQTGNDALLEQLKASNALVESKMLAMDLESQKAEKAEKEAEKLKGRATIKDNFVNTVASGKKMLDALDVLDGTFLETGQSFMDVRPKLTRGLVTAIEGFGGDATQERRVLTAYNTLNKGVNDFALKLFDSLESQTNATFGVLRDSIANMGVDPVTNRRIMGEALTQAKQTIDREGINIPKATEEMLNKLIERINSYQPYGPVSPSNEPVDAEISFDQVTK